jgi:hypothetical protein
LGVLGLRWGGKQRLDQGVQKALEPAQEQTEVVAGGGEHGIDAVDVASFEVIAAHPALDLDVPDDRLDRGTAGASRGGLGQLVASAGRLTVFKIDATLIPDHKRSGRSACRWASDSRNHQRMADQAEQVSTTGFS